VVAAASALSLVRSDFPLRVTEGSVTVPQSKVKITVTRTLSYTGSATYPDDYPGMTLAEAVTHEQDVESAYEVLEQSGKLSTTVTTTELAEE
jgi:hypothetical protein